MVPVILYKAATVRWWRSASVSFISADYVQAARVQRRVFISAAPFFILYSKYLTCSIKAAMTAGLAIRFSWVWWDAECASSIEAFFVAVSVLSDPSRHV